MKIMEIAALTGFASAFAFSLFCTDADTYRSIQNNVVRLHIRAASDSAQDQLLKYKVRDAVLENCSCYFDNVHSAEEAAYAAEASLQHIQETAEKTVAENGYTYSVNVKFAKEAFSEIVYDGFTMPAGVYDAVRIDIGNADGHNWWCVMYPPLCLPAASDDADEIFSDDEKEMLTKPQKFRFRLKIADWICGLFGKEYE